MNQLSGQNVSLTAGELAHFKLYFGVDSFDLFGTSMKTVLK